MGLIIEKEKSKREGEEKDEDEKGERGKRKRRKRIKIREEEEEEEIGVVGKVSTTDEGREEAFRKLEERDAGATEGRGNVNKEKKRDDKGRRRAKLPTKDCRKIFPGERSPLTTVTEEKVCLEGEEDVDEEEEAGDAGGGKGGGGGRGGGTVCMEEVEDTKDDVTEQGTKRSERQKDCLCDISCCVSAAEDSDEVRDEVRRRKPPGRKGKGTEDTTGGVLNLENIADAESLGEDTPQDRTQIQIESPGDSPFNTIRFQEKKTRCYQSSRPTSLETIIEDVSSSPFFFQDSIIKSSFDGREDYRGVGENLNYFQERRVEEEDEEVEDEINYSAQNESSHSLQDIPEEDFLDESIRMHPLRSSRIFRGVIENLNFILENEEEHVSSRYRFGESTGYQEFSEYGLTKNSSISSSDSSKYDYGMEELLKDISEKDEEDDGCNSTLEDISEVPTSTLELELLESKKERFVQSLPSMEKNTVGEKDIKFPIASEISRCTQESPSPKEFQRKVSSSKLGCDSSREDESLEGFHFLEDMTVGSVTEDFRTENLTFPELTSCTDSAVNDICNVDWSTIASDPLHTQESGIGSSCVDDSRIAVRDEDNIKNDPPKRSYVHGESKMGRGDELGTGEEVIDKKYRDSSIEVEPKEPEVEPKEPADVASQPRAEPARKISFTVYIQYEAVSSELTPSESNDSCKAATDDSENGVQLSVPDASVEPSAPGEGVESSSAEPSGDLAERNYQLKLLKAIQSLDSLNDQIVEFIFSGAEFEEEHGGSPKQREALKSSMSLMRRLLVDAQSKFRKMVEDNKQLASRIDGELQTAHQEVNILRQELADTNRRITQIQEHNNHIHHQNMDDIQQQEEGTESPPPDTTTTINGPSKYHSESSSNQMAEEMSQLRLENEKLSARNRSLQREVEELRRVKESMVEEDLQLKPQINQMTMELTHAKEALSALKADRKRLKAEKFDLLNQMKQLYATLEDKEKELRDFIRNYEQRMKESDESLRHLAAERDETEREKWNILKHARDESEKVVKLSAQLGLKDSTIRKLQDELEMVRKQLTSVGYYSDAESVRTNGLPTPTASTPTCSPQPVSTPTPTPNGRGSSADSGVRLSSDRDSTASHDGGVGTPKESPSLSPLYATPNTTREDRAGENTPTAGGPTPTGTSLNSSAISGLASSSASTGGLSRSAEQLCERLAEAGDGSKVRSSSTLSRKSNKSGGTWGSISRVFARQKKRAALDASLYDGNGSDKRASWSPSSSLCVSPLTEESYSEKLRLLEEAQHIPLERWKAPTVLAWLEVTLGMPQYGAMCAENVRSGKVLLELSDSELEAGLGISHPMHRKKLRLAIEELREPRLTRFPRISVLGHTWVSSEWLPDLGLPQYCDAFANNLVDGRLLEALTKKELEKHLGVHRKFHQASIIHGVHLLRIVRFDRQTLAERRRQSEHVDCDPIVWTNIRWVRWARSIDLAEYADNLKDSGVHGALVVLESSFTADTMATALGIPQSKNIIRRHLATELESLVNPARQQLDEQARYAKLERRRQEKLAAGGSLGRSFSRSYGTGLEKADKDKRRASLRGSLSRALGLRVREEINAGSNNGGESSSSGGQSPAVSSRAHPHHPPQARPRSSVMPSGVYVHHETHRRVKSIGDIETITVTPV